MRHRRIWLFWLLNLSLCVAACTATHTPTLDAIDTVEALDGKTDSTGELRLRADGMTLWLKPTVVPRWQTDHSGWILAGRISRNIGSVSALTHEGALGQATILSARKFEIAFTVAEMRTLIGGQPLFLALQPSSGQQTPYHAKIDLQPRFTRFDGDSRIFVYSWIDAVIDGFDVTMRGRVKTPADVTMLGGFNDDDSEPTQTQESATRWRYDWQPGALLYAGDPVEDALHFSARDADGNSLSKRASIEVMLRRVSFTNQDQPLSVWPATTCQDAVLSCLQGLPSWPADTESCGTARDVSPCLAQMPQPPAPPIVTVSAFATDLRRAIIAYYGEHESEILAAGGNTRPQALVSVDSALIVAVTDPEENPLGYDLATHLVYSHPDVVFPGSDIVWFGVYSKSDGSLVALEPFN